jgi:hypothetical protein
VNAALVASYLAEMTGNWLVWGVDPITGKALQFSIPTEEDGGDCWRTPMVFGVTHNTSKNPLVSTSVVGGHHMVDLDNPDVLAVGTISEHEARFTACRIKELGDVTVVEAVQAVADKEFQYVGAEFGVKAF